MEQVLAMGMEEGLTQAVGQIDAILAEDAVPERAERGSLEQEGDDDQRPATEPTTRTLDVPGAVLDLRHPAATTRAPSRSCCSSARRWAPPASPRWPGTSRPHRRHLRPARIRAQHPDGARTAGSTPDEHADDLHRIIQAVGGGPVDLFASSGGAVNALALVAAHPEDVRTLVAHEPPLASILPDREHALAACRAIHDTYERSGWGAGMAHFIVVVQPPGPVHRRGRQAARPGPGDVRDADRGRRLTDRHDARPEHHHQHPLRAGLRRAARGSDQDRPGRWRRVRGRAGEPRRRTPLPSGSAPSRSVFPSHHGGFLGGEYGQTGDPDAFAARLRDVLAANP